MYTPMETATLSIFPSISSSTSLSLSLYSHGFAPINGYQWMGNSLVLSSFPLTNSRGHCLSHTPTCTAAFNSTINMPPSVTPDLWSGYWGDHLYYTLTNLDPTLLPGSTIYRWPEVLGAHSKGHDATIAIIKGAMKIISQKKTITGSKLAEMIRTVSMSCPCVCVPIITCHCVLKISLFI